MKAWKTPLTTENLHLQAPVELRYAICATIEELSGLLPVRSYDNESDRTWNMLRVSSCGSSVVFNRGDQCFSVSIDDVRRLHHFSMVHKREDRIIRHDDSSWLTVCDAFTFRSVLCEWCFGVEWAETADTEELVGGVFVLIVKQSVDVLDPDVMRSTLAVDNFGDEQEVDRVTIARWQVERKHELFVSKHVNWETVLLLYSCNWFQLRGKRHTWRSGRARKPTF